MWRDNISEGNVLDGILALGNHARSIYERDRSEKLGLDNLPTVAVGEVETPTLIEYGLRQWSKPG